MKFCVGCDVWEISDNQLATGTRILLCNDGGFVLIRVTHDHCGVRQGNTIKPLMYEIVDEINEGSALIARHVGDINDIFFQHKREQDNANKEIDVMATAVEQAIAALRKVKDEQHETLNAQEETIEQLMSERSGAVPPSGGRECWVLHSGLSEDQDSDPWGYAYPTKHECERAAARTNNSVVHMREVL